MMDCVHELVKSEAVSDAAARTAEERHQVAPNSGNLLYSRGRIRPSIRANTGIHQLNKMQRKKWTTDLNSCASSPQIFEKRLIANIGMNTPSPLRIRISLHVLPFLSRYGSETGMSSSFIANHHIDAKDAFAHTQTS